MKFHAVELVQGVMEVEIEPRDDNRGFFARSFCQLEFSEHGLVASFLQANVSFNIHRGTIRGMHYQLGDAAEVKLVRCTAGKIFDVALDLRPNSPTFGKWFGTELSAENHKQLYVPRGCAHGFATLTDNAEVSYLVSAPYAPNMERGVRYDDPAFAIIWPCEVRHLSDKDASIQDFDPDFHGIGTLRHCFP